MPKKIIKRFAIMLSILCTFIIIILIFRVNVRFRNSKQYVYQMNECFECENQLQYSVTNAGFFSDDDKELFQDIETDEYEIIGCYIDISVVNNGETSIHINLADYVLTSGGWGQRVNYPLFTKVNKQYNSTLKPGESTEFRLPFTVPSSVFTDKQWDKVMEREYSLVFSLYPAKQEVEINL